MLLITGAAGFIGSNFLHHWFACHDEAVIVLDKLTYAGNVHSIASLIKPNRCELIHGDINDAALVARLLNTHQPRAVLHFAAESHVDRSIHAPDAFIQTNINGTFTLLEQTRLYWAALPGTERDAFRFLHVSTDEVYGSLTAAAPAFTEDTAFAPNSPYSASKAGSDHLVRAYHHTYGLPTLTTHCSNNYGPLQFPEKLIPLIILNALTEKPLPIYGDGLNIRDWLYVTDHCIALEQVLQRGLSGETYNIGGNNEMRNIDVVRSVCAQLDTLQPRAAGHYADLITYVPDRPGHDRRYAIDSRKITCALDWQPKETFATGIEKTVRWYLANTVWINQVRSGEYTQWLQTHYQHTQHA